MRDDALIAIATYQLIAGLQRDDRIGLKGNEDIGEFPIFILPLISGVRDVLVARDKIADVSSVVITGVILTLLFDLPSRVGKFIGIAAASFMDGLQLRMEDVIREFIISIVIDHDIIHHSILRGEEVHIGGI